MCVYKRPFSHKFMVKCVLEFNEIIDKIMEGAMTLAKRTIKFL